MFFYSVLKLGSSKATQLSATVRRENELVLKPLESTRNRRLFALTLAFGGPDPPKLGWWFCWDAEVRSRRNGTSLRNLWDQEEKSRGRWFWWAPRGSVIYWRRIPLKEWRLVSLCDFWVGLKVWKQQFFWESIWILDSLGCYLFGTLVQKIWKNSWVAANFSLFHPRTWGNMGLNATWPPQLVRALVHGAFYPFSSFTASSSPSILTPTLYHSKKKHAASSIEHFNGKHMRL